MQLLSLYPDRWKALANETAEWHFADGQHLRYRLFTVDCGELWLKSGRLVACDPLNGLQWRDNSELQLTPGKYRVVVTVADISDALDGSHLREAYLSLLLSEAPVAGWRFLSPAPPSVELPRLGDHEFIPVNIESGLIALADADAIERLMPDPADSDWEWDLIDSGDEDAWVAQLDDAQHLRAGTANIALPNAEDGENLILSQAGWGPGSYALVGTYAADGTLTGVHIDLAVLPLAPLPEWD
ncbi:MAG: DUF4241 domain-containing protein [Chitinivorax sp.]